MTAEEELAARIHAAPDRLVLAAAGGGSDALRTLLCVPGASRTVLEALAPYSAAAMTGFLGGRPEQFCSARTARAMAVAAYQRARRWRAAERAAGESSEREDERLLGVGCTASLASLTPKRGAHRAYVALQSSRHTETVSLELEKGARRRIDEEQVVGRLILQEIAAACGLDSSLLLPLRMGETIRRVRTEAPPAWRGLLRGAVDKVRAGGPASGAPDEGDLARPGALFPGAFDPLHQGHRAMAETAEQWLGRRVHFELSIVNVDKPPLDFTEMEARIQQFGEHQPVWLTRAPRFLDKARLFPGAVFVVGADTIRRVGDARYWGGDEAACRRAIEEMGQRGCRFLVFGRAVGGVFESLSKLVLPDALRALCDEVPESRFRQDVSSTELRRRRRPGFGGGGPLRPGGEGGVCEPV